MSVDEDRTPGPIHKAGASCIKAGASSIGAGLFIAFLPVHVLTFKEAYVAIAALTFALIGGAFIVFGACRAAMESACLTAEVRAPCRPAISTSRQVIRHVDAEFTTPAQRRFRSARRCTSAHCLLAVSCVQ